MDHFKYLFSGIEGYGKLVPWMWASIALMLVSIALLINPAVRRNENILAVACVTVFAGTWIDKGFGLVVGGFVPNPLHKITEYWPTMPEVLISLGVWAAGFLILTLLYKIAISVKEEIAT